jgi:hypothetical protein
MVAKRRKIIACATVIEEILPLLPPDVSAEELDFGLHIAPDQLRDALQQSINRAYNETDTLILGYGLCSMAVVGLMSPRCTLVVPRVDDCIALFLGSATAYRDQFHQEPGTYYMTKGWIEKGDTPFEEYKHLIERYGKRRADRVMEVMFKNYTRLVFIDTGRVDQERYREYARKNAQRFHLRYEEVPGSPSLLQKMIHGPWDDDFVVARPGETIRFQDFRDAFTVIPGPGGLSFSK